jgi:hypothetical protein
MKKLTTILLFLAFTSFSFAIDGLIITTSDYCFKEKWNNTIGSSIPSISTCNSVFKKQNFFITAIAADYSADKEGVSNVQYAITITKPDKSVYFTQENLPIINGKIANIHNLQMSDAIIKIAFEDSDSFGKYTIEVTITDKISGKSKKFESEITLKPLPAYSETKVVNDAAFSTWMSNYYKNPKPEETVAYYLYYSQSKFAEKQSSYFPVFSVFLEIAKNNQFLLPQILDCYKTQEVKQKIYLLYLLFYSEIGTDDFFNSLEGNEKEIFLKIKDVPFIDCYSTISDPAQLDVLWGTFSANGSYKPILKLIQTLDYTKYQGDLDKYKTSEKTADDRQKAINNAIYNALTWSIKSNCKQRPLVKEYCEWALLNENLPPAQKEELSKIIEQVK